MHEDLRISKAVIEKADKEIARLAQGIKELIEFFDLELVNWSKIDIGDYVYDGYLVFRVMRIEVKKGDTLFMDALDNGLEIPSNKVDKWYTERIERK
jgi:hypothetical protein